MLMSGRRRVQYDPSAGIAEIMANLAGRRVLVVEDEYFIAQDLQRGLEEAGAEVIGPVADPHAALDLIARQPLDFAVLDINLMGGINFSVATELTARKIPFLFATGYEPTTLPPQFQQVGLWRKPFEVDALSVAISGVLDQRGALNR